MDSSRRAVESYWRSRMIDAATSDEDKVAPVYKLEEICDLLRSSHVSIVKELSGFILKRLDHKSPIVKQKALRLIKYAVGKSGVEFRREMQRHSVAVRPLIHYKGQLDPLKGDALNKAVRETAQEVITSIFSEENKPQAPPVDRDDRSKRIQGFGNTSYEAPSDDKKSFISEVVGLGSASIKQGLSNFSQTNSFKKNDNGSYKSPNLHRSLTRENQYDARSDPVEYGSESRNGSGFSKNTASGTWNQDLGNSETTNGNFSSSSSQNKTPEERLLETIVTSGGVRLQPTRDAIQVFLGEAVKLNVLALSHAIDVKLQAPHWQVRMKAVCVLESILRRKDEEPLSNVALYFDENREAVVKCSESPQSSLREKANKVLSLLGEEQTGSIASTSETLAKANLVAVNQMPDLIDTGYSDGFSESGKSAERQSDQVIGATSSAPPPLIDDLFGDTIISNAATSDELKNDDDDPFADVSFHTNESKESADDLFSGMTVDSKNGPELFDIFGPNNGNPTGKDDNDVAGLMSGLSINQNEPNTDQKGNSSGALSQDLFSDPNNIIPPQLGSTNSNFMFPPGVMPYNMPPGMVFNQAFGSQQVNYGAMGNLFAQQLATMSNFQQHLGNMAAQNPGGVHNPGLMNSYSPALPDIFQPNFPSAVPNSAVNNTKKEDTKAFDFISDHIAAARDPKRLV